MAISTVGVNGLSSSGLSASALTTGTMPFAQLPTGSVLQVVNGFTSTLISSSTSTFIDTGLTVTITPKFSTSKILVFVHQNGLSKDGGNVGADMKLSLFRNNSVISNLSLYTLYTGATSPLYGQTLSTSYLDSPATTSATTYKTQFAAAENTGTVVTQVNGGSSTSTITAMEIAG